MVRAYNGQSLVAAGSVRVGDDADNLRWDQRTDSVMVGYGEGAIAFFAFEFDIKIQS